MNDKKNFLILLVIMVVLVGGAYLLYDTLGDKLEGPGLVVQENAGAESSPNANQSEESSAENAQSTGQADGNGTDSTPNGTEQEVQRELAPDFTVYDSEGNAYKLSDFRGKPVIVNFWASWCGPCKSEMPDFQEIYEEYGEEIHFLMVNLTDGAQETIKSASEFIEDSGYSFPVYYDTTTEAAINYGVYSIPTTFFFDAEGYGVAYGSGALDKATLQRGIEMIYSSPSN